MDSVISLFYLFLLVATLCKSAKASSFLPFLYQALQRPHQFVAHAAGIAVYAEAWSYVYRAEVRTVGAVAAPGDGDILTLEDARVALGACFVRGLHRCMFC